MCIWLKQSWVKNKTGTRGGNKFLELVREKVELIPDFIDRASVQGPDNVFSSAMHRVLSILFFRLVYLLLRRLFLECAILCLHRCMYEYVKIGKNMIQSMSTWRTDGRQLPWIHELVFVSVISFVAMDGSRPAIMSFSLIIYPIY
jgi:hypothetical protein